MKRPDEPRAEPPRHDDDRVYELIRRRFRDCATLPLFSEQPPSRRPAPGFFELPDTGAQLVLEACPARCVSSA